MKVSTAGRTCAAALLLASTVGSGVAQAQNFDFSGQWDMNTSTTLPGETKPCSFTGTADVSQEAGQLFGTAVLELVSGPQPCPAEMAADISGVVDGGVIFNGMLFGGMLGEATFDGGLIVGKAAKGRPVAGGFDVIVGPFQGASGGWEAVISDQIFKDSFESLVILSGTSLLVLMLGGGMFFRRRRQA